MAISSLEGKIGVLIRNRSKIIHEDLIGTYMKELHRRVKVWQREIVKLISRPRPKNVIRNTTLWPMLTEGRLAASILTPKVNRSKSYSKKYISSSKITVTGMYGHRARTIGKELNFFNYRNGDPATFAGWKDRADNILQAIISQRLDKLTDSRGIAQMYGGSR